MQLPVPVQLASGADAGSLSTAAIADAPIAMFHGPADVAGIDPRQVIRTDPTPLATDFEPNFLPVIEFDRPDLPWLFSPLPPDDKGRWQPWLTAIVIFGIGCATLRVTWDGVVTQWKRVLVATGRGAQTATDKR